MFTGIIKDIGEVESKKYVSKHRVAMSVKTSLKDIFPGSSVAVNGVCVTVTEVEKRGREDKSIIRFDVGSETLQKTNLGRLEIGARVNLEPALRLTDSIDGHIVTGHIECTGKIIDIKSLESAVKSFFVSAPKAIEKYIVEKGSVAVDGVSLTINTKSATLSNVVFSFVVIPYTLSHTTLGLRKVGEVVNIEPDILCKYLLSRV
jgi:riboflavin synthase